MRLRIVVGTLFLALLAAPAFTQQAPEPLKQDQIMDLVKAGMDPTALVKLIREHGLDFELTDDYVQALRSAKTPDAVIQALRAVKPQPLSRAKLLALVAGGLPSARVAELVHDRGVAFYADDEYLQTLRLAGADDAVVSAVRAACASAAADLEVATSPNAEVYLDGQLQGRAGTGGNLAVKSVSGPHTLKVSLAGKKDFEQRISLTARQANKVEAPLDDVAVASTPVVIPYSFPAPFTTPPMVKQANDKAEECTTLVNIWNMKLQQAMSTRDYSHRGAMLGQINDVNQERLAAYRSKLLPAMKDLQQKMLAELDRTSSEHLDYEMVNSALQVLQVCSDLRSLASRYQMKMLERRSHP